MSAASAIPHPSDLPDALVVLPALPPVRDIDPLDRLRVLDDNNEFELERLRAEVAGLSACVRVANRMEERAYWRRHRKPVPQVWPMKLSEFIAGAFHDFGSVQAAAKALGCSRTTFRRFLRKAGVELPPLPKRERNTK